MGIETRRIAIGTCSPLDVAEHEFQLLSIPPNGLTVHGRGLPADLPRHPIAVVELRRLLTGRAVSNRTRDGVWRYLVRRARNDGAPWMVGAVGMALPALRGIAGQITHGYSAGNVEDIDTEVLAGFIAALCTIDLGRPYVRSRLCDAARRAGLRARRLAETHSGRHVPLRDSAPSVVPGGHPDFLLADAVAQGIVGELDAELIGRTRLEGLSLAQAAAELGLTAEAAKKRRQRAEPMLCAAVREGVLTSDMSLTIRFAAPREIGAGVSPNSARSRSTLETSRQITDEKGGRGNPSGSARAHTVIISPIRGDRCCLLGDATTAPETDAPTIAAASSQRSLAPGHLLTTAANPQGMASERKRPRRRNCRRVIRSVLLVAIVAVVIAVAATLAHADSGMLQLHTPKPPTDPQDLDKVFNNLRTWLIGLLVTLATLMFTIGGLRYLIAGGDPGEVQKAKSALKAAAIGYGLAVLAPLFVNVLKRVVGG